MLNRDIAADEKPQSQPRTTMPETNETHTRHSPEPWTFRVYPDDKGIEQIMISAKDGHVVARMSMPSSKPGDSLWSDRTAAWREQARADARRIVAAVNAAAGLSPEELADLERDGIDDLRAVPESPTLAERVASLESRLAELARQLAPIGAPEPPTVTLSEEHTQVLTAIRARLHEHEEWTLRQGAQAAASSPAWIPRVGDRVRHRPTGCMGTIKGLPVWIGPHPQVDIYPDVPCEVETNGYRWYPRIDELEPIDDRGAASPPGEQQS